MLPAALAALAAVAAAAASPRPNVVHYLVDDLSPDLTSAHAEAAPAAAYGGGWRTPRLRRLVREGVAFRTAWAPAMCTPSRVSLLTGRYPSETGVYHNNLDLAHGGAQRGTRRRRRRRRRRLRRDTRAVGVLADPGQADAQGRPLLGRQALADEVQHRGQPRLGGRAGAEPPGLDLQGRFQHACHARHRRFTQTTMWTESIDEAADFLLWVEAVAHRCARQQVGNIIRAIELPLI